jgi:hypothetical protein
MCLSTTDYFDECLTLKSKLGPGSPVCIPRRSQYGSNRLAPLKELTFDREISVGRGGSVRWIGNQRFPSRLCDTYATG